MRSFLAALAFAALLLPALANDIGGFRCDNMCPLAETANAHRAYGLEAQSVSTTARVELASMVLANLAKV